MTSLTRSTYCIRQYVLIELNEEYILPYAFDKRIAPAVAAAVAKAARESGVARL